MTEKIKEDEDKCLICGVVYNLEDMYYVKKGGAFLGNVCSTCNNNPHVQQKTKMFIMRIMSSGRPKDMLKEAFPFITEERMRKITKKFRRVLRNP